jgi:glycosyltransferase involved in cell wall biosynthesis
MEIIGSLHVGGAENVVVNLARGIDRDRFDVGVCCTRELGVLADQLIAEGVEVRLVAPSRRRFRHLTPLTLMRHIWRWRPDVIHTHGTTAILHTGPLAQFGVLPEWIHTFHFGNYGPNLTRERSLERRLSGQPSRLIAVSDTQRASLMQYYGIPAARIDTVLNGVAENPFVDDARTRATKRAELGIAGDEIVVGCIAVLSEQKGIPYLIDAATRLLAQHPRMRLLIVGGGPHEEKLRREAEALGFGPRILFTGWRSDSQQLLSVLDVFVMPSLWEAMSMVLLEAMAARRPIVVTDVGENRKVVDDGRCGIVIAPRDADAIVTAVCRVLADPAEAQAMGRRAGERFAAVFTVGHMVRAHEGLYSRPGGRYILARSSRQNVTRASAPGEGHP